MRSCLQIGVHARNQTPLTTRMVLMRQVPSKALAGVVVTSTGLDEATQADVESVVSGASGIYVSQLTASVTHLVANAAGSQKHRIASRMQGDSRIAIVKPSWIAECRGISGNVSPDAAPHLLPPLAGFVICATGFQGADRAEIQYHVQKCGATYSKDLSRICTHLIASAPEGKKYSFARDVGSIHIVRQEWLRECHSQKALLDENDFIIDVRSDCDKTAAKASEHSVAGTNPRSSESRKDGNSLTTTSQDNAENCRGTCDTMQGEMVTQCTSSMILESCCLYIVPSGSESNSAVKTVRATIFRLAAIAGATIAPRWSPLVTHAVIYSVPIAAAHVSTLQRAESEGIFVVDLDWLRHSVSSRSMLSPSDYPPPTWATPASSMMFPDSSSTLAGLDSLSRDAGSRPGSLKGGNGLYGNAAQIFQGVRLAVGPLAMRNPSICTIISTKVLAGRGKVLTHDATGRITSGVPTHVLCPEGLSPGEIAVVSSMRGQNSRLELVTSAWIEQCIQDGRLLAVSSCSLFIAREFELPVKEFQHNDVTIAISGFMSKPSDPDRNRRRDTLSKLAVLLGAKYSERMRRHVATHLVAETTGLNASEKVRRAIEWNIPVVSEEWLLACASCGRLIPTDNYLLVHFKSVGRSVTAVESGGDPSRPPSSKSTSRPRSVSGAVVVTHNRKRGVESLSQDSDEATGECDDPRRQKNPRSASDTGSAEDLLKQLAANLERITDASAAGGMNGLLESNSNDGEEHVGMPKTSDSVEKLDEADDGDQSPVREETNCASRTLSRRKRDAAQPSEWRSLEASQSQMIVHRDLTPPQRSKQQPCHVPRLRTMPSRAAKMRP